jgi:putative tricarboxylic transport membrane protein
MLTCGLLAFVLRCIDVAPATLALGLILGPIADQGFSQTLLQAEASGSVLGAFFGSPLSLLLIALMIFAAGSTYFLNRIRRNPHLAGVASGEL